MSTQPQLQQHTIYLSPRIWRGWWLALFASCGFWLISLPAQAASSCTGTTSTQSGTQCKATVDWSVFNPDTAVAAPNQNLLPAREIINLIARDSISRLIPPSYRDQEDLQQTPSAARQLTGEPAKVLLRESSPLALMLLGLAGLILARRRVQQQADHP